MLNETELRLYAAATLGDKVQVEAIIANEFDPNEMSLSLKTQQIANKVFHIACQNNRPEIVSLLLADKRIDSNFPNKNGISPFAIACENGCTEVVSLLLADERTDVNRPCLHKLTPLYRACHNGHPKVVSLMLDDKRVQREKKSEYNTTALDITCIRERTEVFYVFLKKYREETIVYNLHLTQDQLLTGMFKYYKSRHHKEFLQKIDLARIDAINREILGVIAFCLIVFLSDGFFNLTNNLHNEATRFLSIAASLPQELQMTLCMRWQYSSKSLILSKQSDPIFKMLAQIMLFDFYQACKKGDVQTVRLILDKYPMDYNGEISGWMFDEPKVRNPFLIACVSNHAEVVALLLENPRINPNVIDSLSEMSALGLACEEGKEEIVALLLQHDRIEVNIKQKHDITPLVWAWANPNTPILRLFLKNPRVDLNQRVDANQPILWSACEKNYYQIISLLLTRKEVDVNQTYSNKTPLWIACRENSIQSVAILLSSPRVNVNELCEEMTALSIACERGHQTIVSLLLSDERVDVNKTANNGVNGDDRTPLYIACEKGHATIVSLLLNTKKVDINKRVGRVTAFYAAFKHQEIKSKMEMVTLFCKTPRSNIDIYIDCINAHLNRYCNYDLNFSSRWILPIKRRHALCYKKMLADPALTKSEKLLIAYALVQFCEDEYLIQPKGTLKKSILIEHLVEMTDKFHTCFWPDTQLRDVYLIAQEIAKEAAKPRHGFKKSLSGSALIHRLFTELIDSPEKTASRKVM